MAAHALECEQRTHIGLLRATNEDYLDCFSDQGLLLLADGMGGHRAGNVAARMAVEAAADKLLGDDQKDSADDLKNRLLVGEAVEHANRRVCTAAEQDSKLAGMGTTLLVAFFRGNRVFHAHVGDSRLYRLRAGELHCLTRDHSLVQDLLDKGTYANRAEVHAAGIGDNILTRGVGLRPEVEVDVGAATLARDDIYLVCSDGLCGRVPDDEIRQVMLRHIDLGDMADALIVTALAAGGRDNISLIVARPQA